MAEFTKNLIEIAISALVAFVLSIFFSILGAFIGGIIAYVIMKRANPESVSGFRDDIILFATIAIIFTALFIIATSFFLNAIEMPTYQLLGVKNLIINNEGWNQAVIMSILNILIGALNIPAFMLGVYMAFIFLGKEGEKPAVGQEPNNQETTEQPETQKLY